MDPQTLGKDDIIKFITDLASRVTRVETGLLSLQKSAPLKVKMGTLSLTAAGSFSVTDIPFTPKLIHFYMKYTDGTAFDISSFGWTDGVSEFAQCIADAGGTTHSLKSITDGSILATTSGGSDRRRGTVDSFNDDGFSYTLTTVSGGADYDNWGYVAFG